eukprot:COSAG05_NODE_2066_length_3619_cov_2.043466_4_plen_66_part_00
MYNLVDIQFCVRCYTAAVEQARAAAQLCADGCWGELTLQLYKRVEMGAILARWREETAKSRATTA